MEFSDSERHFIEDRSWHSSWAETLRHEVDASVERDSSDQLVDTWASSFEELGRYMGANPRPRDIRLVAAGRLMADLSSELAQAALQCGVSVEEFAAAMSPDTLVESFSTQPFVGRLLEVTYQRLRNAQTRWRGNDLNDLTYLCCAAAYADIIVGEKATVHHLVSGRKNFPPGAVVLSDLTALRSLLPSGSARR